MWNTRGVVMWPVTANAPSQGRTVRRCSAYPQDVPTDRQRSRRVHPGATWPCGFLGSAHMAGITEGPHRLCQSEDGLQNRERQSAR